MQKYFRTVMFQDTTIAQLSLDGQIYLFDPVDIVVYLLENHLHDESGFFFNDTKDRYCAEWVEGKAKLLVNPSIVSKVFGFPVLQEEP